MNIKGLIYEFMNNEYALDPLVITYEKNFCKTDTQN